MTKERRVFWTRNAIDRSLSNTNDFSEEEEVTETLQRTKKIIRGSRKNRDSSDSETRIPSRVKWQLQSEQQKEADKKISFVLAVDWGRNNHAGELQQGVSGNVGGNKRHSRRNSRTD